ncbi:hypothetical protein NOF55_14120 [Rhizobiaceae bacterium BDR2-2]|uniref:Uncharacterized protein n=1 Tax=Ectorhizobium quercum TaxID=2965071 RepID=A0AAE3SX94_9HYPH|nr:hypothetical protein [Ectorhizobium quercum]MCX8998245.1 hypothetical protein [Ectorhizobium quercum]
MPVSLTGNRSSGENDFYSSCGRLCAADACRASILVLSALQFMGYVVRIDREEVDDEWAVLLAGDSRRIEAKRGHHMVLVAQGPRADSFRRIIRQLVDARTTARQLGLTDVDRLLEMALLDVVVEWSGVDLNAVDDAKLEAMMKMRVRQACERPSGASVHLLDEWRRDSFRLSGNVTEPTPVE